SGGEQGCGRCGGADAGPGGGVTCEEGFGGETSWRGEGSVMFARESPGFPSGATLVGRNNLLIVPLSHCLKQGDTCEEKYFCHCDRMHGVGCCAGSDHHGCGQCAG